mmetsp:Transcript_26161/g.39206  ORF Transcript_26161/g.39206 Transcript_26161/m.39206 type:complete len:563 (+) Transcript_26161:121-1809(+)
MRPASIPFLLALICASHCTADSGADNRNHHDVKIVSHSSSNDGEGVKVSRSEADTVCSVCSRFGTKLLPNNRPLPGLPGLTCEYLQEYDVGLKPSDSPECIGLLDLFENRCCDLSAFPESYECETTIRSSLFHDSYDPTVRPVQTMNTPHGTMRAVDVKTVITFLTLRSLDIKASILEIFVAIDLTWNDPRLRWDFNQTNCAPTVTVRANPSIEETEIWVPSLDLRSRASSAQDLPNSLATVRSDGTVSWMRLGPLNAICSFVGLPRMPFDDLGCRLYFGDNDVNTVVNYKLVDLGNNLTKGFQYYPAFNQSYTEYSQIREKTRTDYNLEYSENEFHLDLYFGRANRHYITFSIFPTIIFTLMSFGQFAIHVKSGERLSFSITIVLITVAQSIVTADILPVCNEMIWLNVFNFVSMLFTLLGILETLLILWFFTVASRKQAKEKEVKEDEELHNLISNDVGLDPNLEEDDANSGEGQNDEFTPVTQRETRITNNEDDDMTKQNKTWKDLKIVRTFTQRPKTPEEVVDRIDFLCLIFLPIAYTLFIVIMFAANERWGEDPSWA